MNTTIKFTISAATLLAGCISGFGQEGPKLSPDLHEIANLKDFKERVAFKPQHLAALGKNGFFTSPTNEVAPYWVYGRNDYLDLPSIVTTDNVLEIYHSMFDSVLRNIEDKKLTSGTRKISAEILRLAEHDLQHTIGLPVHEAALRNVAFFGVADRLIGDTAPISSEALPFVKKVLALVGAHQGFQTNPIFGYDTDFSQFLVRGHYTKSKSLGRYFQSQMWFGLVPFSVPDRGGAVLPVQQALLIARDLAGSPELARWRRMYDVTSLFAGSSNHLTPIEWEAVSKRVFGPAPKLTDFSNASMLSTFVSEVRKARPPIYGSNRTSGNNPDSVQMRFFGQRAVPDGQIFAKLSGDQRVFPSPLDVMSILGSASASRILDASPAKYNPTNWDRYLPNRQELATEFASYPSSKWKSDLYWSWLDSFRTLFAKPDGYPAFMKTQAWSDKSLFTALASWTELKHDTILYGEQTVAEMGDEEPPNHLKEYVEPNVDFYNHMIAEVHQISRELDKRSYLDSTVSGELSSFAHLLEFFVSVSNKELKGQKLTQEENDKLRYIEGDLEARHNSLLMYVGGYKTLTQEDLDTALVSDVHTGGDQALQVAVGHPDNLFAVVRIEGKLWLTRGTTLSYYEFKRPISDRMTDHAWKQQLASGHIPNRPEWVKSFFVPIEVKEKKG